MSLYQDLKEARTKVSDLEFEMRKCNHDFLYTAGETTTVKTNQYSPMDGIVIEGPTVYGFRKRRTCNICGLQQKAESTEPGKWSNWEDT
jgi:hypothetical protein